MTTFVLSHNLQITSDSVPAIDMQDLAEALVVNASAITAAQVLDHPHWALTCESSLEPVQLAHELVKAWKTYRQNNGHTSSHTVLALGGRKDSVGAPGSPLQEGYWGVDVVETQDPKAFLAAINWDGLKSTRPQEAVFEILA